MDYNMSSFVFGTGGIREVMGQGEGKMNDDVIILASLALARFLFEKFENPKVLVAYDSRINSKEWANLTAKVLVSKGVEAFVFDRLCPTPVLSFAILHLNLSAGVVITASHNTKEYNGYKVYGHTGVQCVPQETKQITKHGQQCSVFDYVEPEADIQTVGEDVLRAFYDAVLCESVFEETATASELNVVFTPLHGTGGLPVLTVLREAGFRDVLVVEEQFEPDGNFPTVDSPNPEEPSALKMAIDLANQTGADIVIGTDPDCDRVGVAVRHMGKYVQLSGNEAGALLTGYLLFKKSGNTLVKTVVSGELGGQIARQNGLNVINTPTGFKYIGEQMESLGEDFFFAYEESFGYLGGRYARDKCGVGACLLLCQCAAHHKQRGKTLVDALNELKATYGHYQDFGQSIRLDPGQQEKVIERLKSLDGILEVEEAGSFLKLHFHNGWIAVRPSGTEPKLKLYYSAKGESHEAAQVALDELKKRVGA